MTTTSKSLFIQVRSYDPAKLAADLEHVRLHHKDRGRPDYIHNIVLDEIGTEAGLAMGQAEVLRERLPEVADNIFVGSHFVPFEGSGSAYVEGMADSDHRWANLNVQRDLWLAWAAYTPGLFTHWYINHEGVLDRFDIPEVRAGYEAFLIQSVRDGHKIKPNRAVLWSPAIWSGVPLTLQEEDAIRKTFRRVRYFARQDGHLSGVSWLHFQDMMGRGRADITKEDVRQWYHELAKAYDWASLRVNMELFSTEGGVLGPMDPDEVLARETWYKSQGLPVGASWEMRWWMQNHEEA